MTMNYPYDDLVGFSFSDLPATASTTSSCEEHGNSLDDLSLEMDWDSDLRHLVESMMGDEGVMLETPTMLPCNSTSTGFSMVEGEPRHDESNGLRLVHLLVAAAEATTGANKTRELTKVILARLQDLVSPTDQTNMVRLAAHFTAGLSKLLEPRPNQQHRDVHHKSDVISAFLLLQNMSPYINFGYLTATQAILEAVRYERRVHIVDYDISEGVQWASLMQAMMAINTGASPQHLSITALSRAKKSSLAVQEVGRRLTAFAESIGQPFSFYHCKHDPETFNASSLKVVRGEAVVINCMLHMPWCSNQTHTSLFCFLSQAKTLNPKLVTLVHEEVCLMGNQDFLYRFKDLLHQFSAMLDSLEEDFSLAGGFVERVFIGPWVSGWLSRITDDAEVESFGSWSHWLETNGFEPVDLSFANRCQAKLLLSLFKDGYSVEEMGCNGLVLGWKTRRLVSASFWASSSESNR